MSVMPNNPIESFKTHSNYIRAFDLLTHDPASSGEPNLYRYLRRRIAGPNILPTASIAGIDLERVQIILHSAWGTEALLSMTRRIIEEEELLRLSNNWSSIQVYYIFYYCTQALHLAKGHPQRPEKHQITQKIFNDYWASRSIVLPPWTLAYGADGAINMPPGIVPDPSVHPWVACAGSNVWNLAIKALMTTRREILEVRYRERRETKRKEYLKVWQDNERSRLVLGKRARKSPRAALPKLTDAEKREINRRLRSYNIMDYFYRLRIKTNYTDSNMFSDGPEDNLSSRNIREAFCRITSATLFLHEHAICNLVGRQVFRGWIDEWICHNLPRHGAYGLASRREYY